MNDETHRLIMAMSGISDRVLSQHYDRLLARMTPGDFERAIEQLEAHGTDNTTDAEDV